MNRAQRRRQKRRQVGALDGEEIPLECEHCTAVAVVILAEHRVSIRHEAHCPSQTDPVRRLEAQLAGSIAVADRCDHPIAFVPRTRR